MSDYPPLSTRVLPFNGDLVSLLPQPAGVVEWPPVQITYLGVYLAKLGCKSVVLETHYVDRDFIDDVARFYSRNLRAYPNYCTRLHFFGEQFDDASWRNTIVSAGGGDVESVRARLQSTYLGFSVIKPLPGSPIGRTVLKTVGPRTADGLSRMFNPIRKYTVHLAGLDLAVDGLAFQQQDQGVSACATTALWTTLHAVAHLESIHIPTPAEITEAASRYLLTDGRSMPSEGLRVEQICEATRATGLAPVVVRSLSPAEDRAQLSGYVLSGLPVVLAINIGGTGHAVCCVGLKLGDVQPQTDTSLAFRDAASRVQGVYVHDDRLGPYASVELRPHTASGRIRTGLLIRWPDGIEEKDAVLHSMIIPVPPKIRLSLTQMRAIGFAVAQFTAKAISSAGRSVTLDVRYELEANYKSRAFTFGLSDDGLFRLQCESALSRYLGVIEISTPEGPLFDVLLDTTESGANPCVLAYVRKKYLPSGMEKILVALAGMFGGEPVI